MPEHGAVAGFLAKDIDAVTTAFLADIRKIDVVPGLQTLLLVRGQNLANVGFEFGV